MRSNPLKKGHGPDYTFLAIVFLLVVFGLLMLSSASSELGQQNFHDSYYYLKHQLTHGLLPGIALFLLLYFIPYRYHQKFAFLMLLVSIVLLALVFTEFGLRANNAQRWLKFGNFSFQPAELLKIFFITYLAAWFANPKAGRAKKFYEGFIPLLIVFAVIAALLLKQPATSIVVVLIGAGTIVYFSSGTHFRYILALFLIGVFGLGGLIYFGQGHRLERIVTYLNPGQDVEETGYHLDKALTAVGSGRIWGLGFGNSTIKKSLPARIDDSIFAVIAGEFGFVGAGTLVALFGLLTLKIFWIAKEMHDRFGELILIGFGSVIFLQSFFNMAAISGLVPLTGLPLPFISYGGTALATFLAMSGIIANVSRYT